MSSTPEPPDAPAPRASAAGRLCTVGYERRSVPELAALLRAAGVAMLVDVREAAWSRRPDFSRRALEAALAGEGLAYVHAGFAGSPSELRHSGLPEAEVFARYAAHLDAHPGIEAALETLVGPQLDAGRGVCLMCRERDPAHCHRGVLAARWEARSGRRVEHLGVDGAPAAAGQMAFDLGS